ncbi:unnamed protein product [marine sediment metagenome]|uniref:Uncharacterized protein n=1 Tax=marine sediment metagenome TaxID=412755 RepID=X1RPU5_9ZZZZ
MTVLESKIANKSCAKARQISKGKPCINRRYPPCWIMEMGFECPEIIEEKQRSKGER